MGRVLWIANEGTPHELTITEDGYLFCVDNVPNYTGSKTWNEFPRTFYTVQGCKRSAANVMGAAQKWTCVEQEA